MKKRVLVCKEINCPWFCNKSNGYGCRRYVFSAACHLGVTIPGAISNEYALYANLNAEEIESLKKVNDRVCLNDSYYQEQREFFKENPSWETENTFIPREIVQA